MASKQLAPTGNESPRRHVAGIHASRPVLHLEVARTAAVTRHGAAWARTLGGPTWAEIVGEVGAVLSRTSKGTYRDVVCDTTSAVVAAHLRSHGTGGRRLAEALSALIGGDLRDELTEIWDGVDTETAPPTLDGAVGALVAEGVDGERLAGAIVRFEAQRHERLIWQQAHKLSRVFPDRESADLVGWGWQGLVTALRRYDPSVCMLSTYACPKIAGAIRDGVRSEDPLPKRLTTYKRKVANVSEELTQSLGRTPSLGEVAERIGADLKDQALINRLGSCASIDELCAQLDGDRVSEPDWMGIEDDAADASLWAVARDDIDAALALLAPEDAEAIRLLDLERLDVAAARAVTGATARQLRQRRARGHEALRSHLAQWADAISA